MNIKERKAMAAKLAALRGQLLDAVQAYNDLTNDMDTMVEQFVHERMQEAREAVTKLASELASEVEDAGTMMRAHIEEKTDQWHDSDTGQTWEEICSEFENITLDELTDESIAVTVTVEELDADDVDNLSDAIEQLQEL